MDVLSAVWVAAGRPCTPPARRALPGRCARCAAQAQLVPTRHVVSKVFTAFDGWADPSGPGLCPSCRWAYANPEFRQRPHLVRQRPDVQALEAAGVYALLSSGPLEPTCALTVPLRPGRKHLVPLARWGQVTLDDLAVPWRTSDAIALRTVGRLRSLGFGSRMLAEPAPAWSVLRQQPRSQWSRISADWASLQCWRPASPWLSLALHLTLKETR